MSNNASSTSSAVGVSASVLSKLRLPISTDPPSERSGSSPKTWLIFGATGHVGRSVVKAALRHGDRVTAVGKSGENSMQQMQDWHERCIGDLCDVRVRETVEAVITRALKHWHRIDIIVNCTGYGVIGACEDQDDDDLRSQFEVNFMGTLNIIQLSLPVFRAQAERRDEEREEATGEDEDEDETAGRYIIFSSTSGALGVPGLGPYCATKYAVEGLVESMLYEVDAFGIKATLVEPGHMRLDDEESWGLTNTSDDVANRVKHLPTYGHFFVKTPSPPYDTPTAPAGHARRVVQWFAGRQTTSVVKSAELVWQLGHCRYPPLRLLLGSFAVESVRDRLKGVTEEIEDWKHLHFFNDAVPGGPQSSSSAAQDQRATSAKQNPQSHDDHDDEDEGDDHFMDLDDVAADE